VAAKRVSRMGTGQGATKHTRKADGRSLRTRRSPATQDNPRPASHVDQRLKAARQIGQHVAGRS